jgi:hypothetical protein
MTSIAPSPAAEEAPRISSGAPTCLRRAPKSRTAPMFATSTPTVWASQKSAFGPVARSKVRRLMSGQTPVARKYEPCREATRAFAEASLNQTPIGAVRTEEGELGRLVVGEISLPTFLISWQPDRPALDALRNEGDLFGAHADSS